MVEKGNVGLIVGVNWSFGCGKDEKGWGDGDVGEEVIVVVGVVVEETGFITRDCGFKKEVIGDILLCLRCCRGNRG